MFESTATPLRSQVSTEPCSWQGNKSPPTWGSSAHMSCESAARVCWASNLPAQNPLSCPLPSSAPRRPECKSRKSEIDFLGRRDSSLGGGVDAHLELLWRRFRLPTSNAHGKRKIGPEFKRRCLSFLLSYQRAQSSRPPSESLVYLLYKRLCQVQGQETWGTGAAPIPFCAHRSLRSQQSTHLLQFSSASSACSEMNRMGPR